MDISDADMIMAADRGERLYRARRAQALLRGARAARAPMSRFAPRLMRAPVYGSRPIGAYRRNFQGNTGPETKCFDCAVIPDGTNMTGATYSIPYITGVAGVGATNAFTQGLSCINMVQ